MAGRPIGRYGSQDASFFRSLLKHDQDASVFRNVPVQDQDASGFRSMLGEDRIGTKSK